MERYSIYIQQLSGIIRYTCILFVSISVLTTTSCKKLLEVDAPPTSTNEGNVYANDINAASVLTGIYASMSSNGMLSGGITSMPLVTGLSSDELTLFSGVTDASLIQYYQNSVLSTSVSVNPFWNTIYSTIFITNSAITGLNNSNTLTPAVKTQLLGEAKFIRGFCYFYLVNLYGDVPLPTTTDYKVNASLARTGINDVYQQILLDLEDASNLLSTDYLAANIIETSADRVRPTKWAANALLARVHLFLGNGGNTASWKKAEDYSSTLINNSQLFSVPDVALNDVFLMNSQEAIWQLQPLAPVLYNTQEARTFIIPEGGPSGTNPVYLSPQLLNGFEPADKRKTTWISSITSNGETYYYPYKYKSSVLNDPLTEYSMVMRMAEQYLIRAEARAQQGNLTGALDDLNVIRKRAGLKNSTAVSQSDILAAILKERQVELFTEWGHRWLDLKRTGQINTVMPAVSTGKGGEWQSFKALYPIPQKDIDQNPALRGHQNTGYN